MTENTSLHVILEFKIVLLEFKVVKEEETTLAKDRHVLLDKGYPIKHAVLMEIFYTCSDMDAISHMGLLSPLNVASVMEELNFNFIKKFNFVIIYFRFT